MIITYGPAHERPWWWRHLKFDRKGCNVDYRRISMGTMKSSQISTFRLLILSAMMTPFLLKARRKYDYVFTFECDITTFIISLFQTLTLSRRPRHVVLQFIMREKRRDLGSRLKYLFMRLCFSSVYRVVCSSASEADYYREAFGWDSAKAAFTPMHTDPAFLEPSENTSGSRDSYIIAAGRTFRDYETLISAVAGLDIRTIIVASQQNIPAKQLPGNVSVFYDISYAKLQELITGCEVMVLPLEDRCISTGQSVMLQAMAAGKAVIATRTSGTIDYIQDMENGVLVEPKNPEKLRAAISALLESPELRRRLGSNARKAVQTKYLPEHYYEGVSKIIRS